MARRASSKSSPAATFGILAGVIILLGAGFFFVFNKKADGFDSPPLPVADFQNNANSMRGNLHSVQGRIHSITPRDNGKFIHLIVDDAGQEKHIPIVVPDTLTGTNLYREQNYAFEVTVEEGGILMASALRQL
ncbi:MAG: hypothetical protein AAGC74_07315 [Verrucomicrobiota bacterium]